MRNTKIEWCDHTVNLWWGCSEVSEACANCYARGIAKRFGKDCWGKSTRWDRRDDAYVEIRKLDAQSKKKLSPRNGIRKFNVGFLRQQSSVPMALGVLSVRQFSQKP